MSNVCVYVCVCLSADITTLKVIYCYIVKFTKLRLITFFNF